MTALLVPGKRGHKGLGGGAFTYMPKPVMHRGPSNAIAGLNPFVVGGGVTNVGVPLGRIESKFGKVGVLHCDHFSWFERIRLISSPSMYIAGLNGLGKSSLVRRLIIGLEGYGISSLVPGDVKGEHTAVIRALDGDVVELGRGLGCLNVLDLTEVFRQAKRLSVKRAEQLLALARSRRQAATEAMFVIDWGRPMNSDESHILAEALRLLDGYWETQEPVMEDLRWIISRAPQSLLDVALVRGDMAEYHRLTRSLESSLTAWVKGHGIGEVFAGKSTVQLRRGFSSAVDISGIDDQDWKLQAAAMVASWNASFTQVAISHALADDGLEAYRPVNIVTDEMWRILRLPGMVDLYDALTRLDRQRGVGRILVSHSLGDSQSLLSEQDRIKATGFFERSGVKMLFGLPRGEMPLLEKALHLSEAEQEYLVNNTTQDSWDPDLDQVSITGHPGQGKILCKTGAGKPGIPFHLDLVAAEKGGLNDTNQHWNMR